MSPPPDRKKVAVITGASQGIGAGVAAGFRRAGYAVVATSRSIAASKEPDFLAVQGDIAEADTRSLRRSSMSASGHGRMATSS